ncbi:hypothetical protein AVL50_03390 [Flammeovirga sp. SJP92]|nr:hypothetical protein AVL50_03390 [Flammeovirga sp. SJP92]
MSIIYFFLFILGTIVPYYELIDFLFTNGFNFHLFFEQLLMTNISRFFAYDVIISAVVLIVFILHRRTNVQYYGLAILATFFIGVSAGLPLFLYLKEKDKQILK